jgi:YVTN family beta-propeller protein
MQPGEMMSSVAVYVLDPRQGIVHVIDAATNSIVAAVPVGPPELHLEPRELAGCDGLAATPDNRRVYVVHQSENGFFSVSILDTATNAVLAKVPLISSRRPSAVAITQDGKRAYVSASDPGAITVFDTQTHEQLATHSIASDPISLAITPDDKQCFVTTSAGTVLVLDTATNALVAEIDTSVAAGAGAHRNNGIAITPDGKHALVADLSAIWILETISHSVLNAIPLDGINVGIAITGDGSHTFVANLSSDTVSVLENKSQKTIAKIPVNSQGGHPLGVAITPDDKHLYVTNGKGHVAVIDCSNNSMAGLIGNSFGVAIAIASLPDRG